MHFKQRELLLQFIIKAVLTGANRVFFQKLIKRIIRSMFLEFEHFQSTLLLLFCIICFFYQSNFLGIKATLLDFCLDFFYWCFSSTINISPSVYNLGDIMFLRCFFAAAIKDICLKACVKISQPILIYYIIEIIGGILHIRSGLVNLFL